MNGKALQAWRRLHGVTQYRLAKATGWPRSKISEIENGHKKISPTEVATLQKGMAKVFNQDV